MAQPLGYWTVSEIVYVSDEEYRRVKDQEQSL